jgi:hypothetical protein
LQSAIARLAGVSEAESPKRTAPEHRATEEDVRQLMGASTPHFALQLRERIAKLIAPLVADDPARILGEREIRRLDALALDGETRGAGAQDGQRPLASLRD